MENVKVYLSGSMSGISWEEQTEWRRQVMDIINDSYHKKNVSFFDPTRFYNFKEKQQRSEREVMEFDLYNLRNSDLVIVNINNQWSLGTMSELILAKEYRIPVIGWNSCGEELHPWLSECFTRMCDDISDTIEHVIDFYLN